MCTPDENMGYAFNNENYADLVLHLQITPTKSETLHLATPLLASCSPFFYKLIKNTIKKDVTLAINSTEELEASIDMLSFLYKGTLKATASSELLAVLMAADKFEVRCCMEYCIQSLLKLPISVELAELYVDLPSRITASEVVQPLVAASKRVIAAAYMEKAAELPLSAIEFVLTTDGLQVYSEDDVFDFVMKWSRARYPNAEERQETLTKHLWPLVHFQYMSDLKLNEVLVCADIDYEHASKLVSDALMAKLTSPYGQHLHPRGLVMRAYIHRLVKVVPLDLPNPRCVVYLNLTREDCANLFPSNQLDSQMFALAGRSFSLRAKCHEEANCFGLYLMYRIGSCDVDFELAVMSRSSHDFQPKFMVKNHILGEDGWGSPCLLGISWDKFMSDDNEYFINDILHLQVKISLNDYHTALFMCM